MNIFKTFTLKWWQTGIFKLGMLTLGIAIGMYWHALFGGCLAILTTSRTYGGSNKYSRKWNFGRTLPGTT
jgi:hypothetical protein